MKLFLSPWPITAMNFLDLGNSVRLSRVPARDREMNFSRWEQPWSAGQAGP